MKAFIHNFQTRTGRATNLIQSSSETRSDMFDKSHSDNTETTESLSEMFASSCLENGVTGSQPLLVDAESNATKDNVGMSVGELLEHIQLNLSSMRTLMGQVKQQEKRGDIQESEIIRLQPKLRGLCRQANKVLEQARAQLNAGRVTTEEGIGHLDKIQHEIDILREERVMLYSRCRKRHASSLLSINVDVEDVATGFPANHSKNKNVFWKQLRLVKKHLLKA